MKYTKGKTGHVFRKTERQQSAVLPQKANDVRSHD